MSPRAACRLESLGFTDVYDYVPGKTDWTGSGLPTEGEEAGLANAGTLAQEVPTCRLEERIGAVRTRIGDATSCIVVSDDGIVLGRLRQEGLDDTDATVQDVMEEGPTTVRCDEALPGLVERMRKHEVPEMIVTVPSGRLVGVMRRDDAERVLERLHHEHHH